MACNCMEKHASSRLMMNRRPVENPRCYGCQFFLIAFSLTVRDLGLTLDQRLTFAPHINRLCRDCYYQLRQLSVNFRSLTSTATATLVHAFVTSRLDYCSTLYLCLPSFPLGFIERVIRTAARRFCGLPRNGDI